MSANPRAIPNVKSRLLSDQENEAIFRIIGRRCLSLCTTLAELSQAEDETKQTWKTVCSGVVCLVKDHVKRSYFIRFYGGEDKTMVWEHDIRRNLSLMFKTDSLGLLTVTVKDFKLTFLDKDEAEMFKTNIEEYVTGKRERARARARAKAHLGPLPPPPPPQPSRSNEDVCTLNTKGSKNKKKKEKLTKENISSPMNCRQLDPVMQDLFKQIGFNDQSKTDEETLDFIYDFIGKHGGPKQIQSPQPRPPQSNQNTNSQPPPPAKLNIPPPPPPNRTTYPKPPPPGKVNTPPPPPPNRTTNPLPPPPGKVNIPPPPPPNRTTNPLPPPPGKVNIPPPPPPNRTTNPLPPPPGKVNIPPPPPPPNRTTNPLPPPPGKVNIPPPPPPNRTTNPLPPPPGKVNIPPPPPPNRTTNPLPPPPAKVNEPQPPPPSTGSPHSSQQTSVSYSSPEDRSKDDQLKQQLMQLLLENPSEMTDLIYNIIDKKGGLQEIRDNLAGRKCQPDPALEHDDQVPGKIASDQTVEGATCLTSNDQVPGRIAADTVSGGDALWTSDDELGSDMIDDDDDEWDDYICDNNLNDAQEKIVTHGTDKTIIVNF